MFFAYVNMLTVSMTYDTLYHFVSSLCVILTDNGPGGVGTCSRWIPEFKTAPQQSVFLF